MRAAQNGFSDVIKLLLDSGADIFAKDHVYFGLDRFVDDQNEDIFVSYPGRKNCLAPCGSMELP